ncbi:hypothetical protein AGMMS49983_11710 [Clostridia bacterium]|nr:hypothetical protein AGMMS49983_11710 [Clostridia bacterium]
MKKKLVLVLVAMIVFALATPLTAFADTRTLSGIVTDETTGEAVPGADVSFYVSYGAGDQQLVGVAQTAANGTFTISYEWTGSGSFGPSSQCSLQVDDPNGLYKSKTVTISGSVVVSGDVGYIQLVPLFIQGDPDTGIVVVGDIPPGTELIVTPLPGGAEYDKAKAALDASVVWVYDVSLLLEGVSIQPDGTIYIAIPIPAGYDGSRFAVYRIEADGSKTDMGAIVSDGYLVFTTDHLSTYAIGYWEAAAPAQTGSTNTSPVKQTGADTSMTLIGGLILIAALGGAFAVARKKGLFTR